MRVPVLVTAAGGSSRCPEGKLQKLWRGQPLLSWLLLRLSGHPGVGPTLVVTGHHREEVETLVGAFPGAETVFNSAWASGLSSSLRLGVSRLPLQGGGFLVALGDTPTFSDATLSAVLPDSSVDQVRVPVFEGQRGHPVYFPDWTRPDWATLEGDVGARPLMKAWGDRVLEIPVDDSGILRDFDSSADFDFEMEDVNG